MREKPPRIGGRRAPGRRWVWCAGSVLVGLLCADTIAAQNSDAQGCDACHAELEFLRARTPSLARAQELFAASATVTASAHGELGCADCHAGFARYPHPTPTDVGFDRGLGTATCASCHEESSDAWSAGVHNGEEPADCGSCHGVHDVLWVSELADGAGVARLNDDCRSCHGEASLPEGDPHAVDVSCAACHDPHATRAVDDPAAWIANAQQNATCGECHDTASAPVWADAHRDALAQEDGGETAPSGVAEHEPEDPPACVTCHQSHPLHWSGGVGPTSMDGVCEGCHEEYAETFADSYHGQALTLGSDEVAGCVACHSAHEVFPASDVRSTVSADNRVETCGQCHERSNASFVQFEPHATHDDPDRFPVVFWTGRFMTILLVGVFGVFGLHTVLWLSRLTLDALRRPDAARASEGQR